MDNCKICGKEIELESIKKFKEHNYCIEHYKEMIDKQIEANRNLFRLFRIA